MIGLLAAALVGALMGLAMAVVSVTLQAEQGISGIGFTLFGLGLSSLLFRLLAGGVITAQGLGFQPINIPVLSDIPVIGKILFQQNILVYVAFALVPILTWVLNRTKWGLQIRAVGQNPAAADSMGVNVVLVRYATVIFGGIMAGIAGASLSIAATPIFQENMTEGRGLHRRRAGLLRRLVALPRDAGRAAVQHRQQPANLGANLERADRRVGRSRRTC